jgi:hypothetical protein
VAYGIDALLKAAPSSEVLGSSLRSCAKATFTTIVELIALSRAGLSWLVCSGPGLASGGKVAELAEAACFLSVAPYFCLAREPTPCARPEESRLEPR